MAPSSSSPGKRRGRILVLDDEPLVGRAIVRLLRASHDVLALTSPSEALARAAGGERWDLILCDLMMPGLDGRQFLERLEREVPFLAPRVVFMTGGAFTDEGRAFLEEAGVAHIEKPIDPAGLRALVAARLGAGSTGSE
jgi:CheY-like chemotaxis protein